MSSPEVVLISPFTDISAISLRGLSACLKAHGFQTRMIFLSNIQLCEETDTPDWEFTYPQRVVDQVLELCLGSRLVGISMMTNYHHSMGDLTDRIREKLGIPVVWGGIHPTLRPEISLEHADFACVGEGEDALVELAAALRKDRATTSIRNIFTKRNGDVVRTEVRPLIQDLDSLPFQDYDLSEHFLYRREEQQIVHMDPGLLEVYLDYGPRSLKRAQPTFQVMIARGCPYRCTFCGNQALADLYPGQRYLRRRSNANAIAEIKAFRESFPFVKAVLFSDDSFVMADEETIRDFCTRYTREVGLPFRCMATPRSVTPEKMESLANAGLFFMEVGIQTGSNRINELYQRTWSSREIVMQAVEIINEYKDRITPLYDVILDNPFSTREDEMETLQLILQLPRPYVLQIFSLTLFPGTKLLERALESGMVDDEREFYQKDYRLFRRNYINVLYVLLCRGVPPALVRFLAGRMVVFLFNRLWFEKFFDCLVALKVKWRRMIGRLRVALRWHRQLHRPRET